MITTTLNIDRALSSLDAFEKRFRANAAHAVRTTARTLMSRVVTNTQAPAPPPPVEHYIRTNRLASGWAPGARFVGVETLPPTAAASASNEGSVSFQEQVDQVTYRAENHVPYAREVEEEGTLAAGGSRRPGYFFLHRGIEETRNEGAFEEHLRYAWRIS